MSPKILYMFEMKPSNKMGWLSIYGKDEMKSKQNKTKTSSDLRQMHLFVVPHFSLTYQRFYLYLTDDLRRLFINTKIWCVYGFILYHKHIEYRIVLKLQGDSPHSFSHVFLNTRNLYRINSFKVWCCNYNLFFPPCNWYVHVE